MRNKAKTDKSHIVETILLQHVNKKLNLTTNKV